MLVSNLLNAEFETQGITRRSKVHGKIKKILGKEWREDFDEIMEDMMDERKDKEMGTKGYWLKQAKIESTAQFIEYVKTVVPWLRSVGGTIIAKDVNQNSDLNEWDGGQLGVIVEFESKAAAQKAFNSTEFQEYIKCSGIENQLSLSIIG